MSDIALLGKKIGMTREFYKTGLSVPVTVLKLDGCLTYSITVGRGGPNGARRR